MAIRFNALKYFILPFFFIGLLGFGSPLHSTAAPGKGGDIRIKGTVTCGFEEEAIVTITIYLENDIAATYETSKNGKFKFDLLTNQYYMIEFSKEDYITKRISVNTNLPSFDTYVPDFEFYAQLHHKKEFQGVDVSILDFPSALIHYGKKEGEMIYNVAYSEQVQDQVRLLKTEARDRKIEARRRKEEERRNKAKQD